MDARHRILLVEDDAAVRGVIRAALEEEGYRVLPSDRPVGPLDVRQLRASLVVLDLMLGGKPDGYGWLEALRRRPGRPASRSWSAAATWPRAPPRRCGCGRWP